MYQVLTFDVLFGIEVRIEILGMYASIRATTTYSLDFFSQSLGQCIFQNPLYRLGIGLPLPSVVGGTLVCEL